MRNRQLAKACAHDQTISCQEHGPTFCGPHLTLRGIMHIGQRLPMCDFKCQLSEPKLK